MTVFQLICRITPSLRRRRSDSELALRREIVNRYLTDWRGRVRADW
ncbi:MAG TPA: hypothetical protein VN903_34960 [Polyangia bacterium]|nr:hypothetical protein [Polyangia bacterium]